MSSPSKVNHDIPDNGDDTDENELNLDEYKPKNYGSHTRRVVTKFDDSDDDLDDNDGVLSSLQKYRPSAYDAGPRDNSDINDIRDYYSNYKTRGFNRYSAESVAGRRFSNTSEQLDDFEYTTPRYQRSSYLGPSRDMHHPSSNGHFEQGDEMQRPRPQPLPAALDDSTKMLLEKARAARNRPMWEPEDPNFERPQPQQYQQQEQPQERNGMERPDWDRPLERPPPYESRLQRDPEETMMNSKTRSLLDKVKESTMGLQDLNAMADDLEINPRLARPETTANPRKTSRFLRREPEMTGARTTDRSDNGYDAANRLADDVLGENLYPPREDPRDSGLRRPSSSIQTTSGYSSGPSRKYSYQSVDTDKYSDRSSEPEVSRPSRRVQNNQEDDELDAMINDLKQKTSGRDMYKMVQDIEGEEQNRTYGRKSVSPVPKSRSYGRKSVSPIPKSRDFYGGGGGATEYNPTSRQVGGSNPASSRPRYDPYEQIRGGTGYGYDYHRAQQPQEQAPQPQQQPTSYGYSQPTRSQTYGYSQQQPPASAYGDPYSSSSYGAMPNPRQQGYMPAQQPVFGYGYQVPQMPQQQMQQSTPMYQSRIGRRASYGYYQE